MIILVVICCKILVLESGNEVLSKVLISGGGRCNVMHDPNKGTKVISKGYPRGERELIGPFESKFGPWETFDWFSNELSKQSSSSNMIKGNNLHLKIESDGRVFPSSDSSQSIIDCLENCLKRLNICVMNKHRVDSVVVNDESDNKKSIK